jgi:hypothetical protein
LYCNTIGCANIAHGTTTLFSNSTGSNNIAIGYNTLSGNTTGCQNIAIGTCAGWAIVTGTNNTVIGNLNGTAGMVCTLLLGAGTCERIRVDNNGLCINGALANIPTTTSNIQLGSLGIGTAASGTTGEIRATNNITAYYSDDRLKTRFGSIKNALEKVKQLNGFYYEANQTAQDLGYTVKREVGVSAQEVQNILPEIVVPAPIDEKYLTVHYDKLIPLLIEAIKELEKRVAELEANQ